MGLTISVLRVLWPLRHAPPFQPPPYRGLSILLSPAHPPDNASQDPTPKRTGSDRTPQPLDLDASLVREPRERSETMSTSSESYHSSGTTEGTSPSVADFNTTSPKLESPVTEEPEMDVQMHPCESDSMSVESEEETGPSCILLNSLHVHEVFDIPKKGQARFRTARLPQQINLRNLNIQQIKYATISDLVLYTKNGVGSGVLDLAEQ